MKGKTLTNPMNMKRFFTLLLLLCPLLMAAQTTRHIKGQILNRTDGTPIVGATVFIDPANNTAKNYNPQGTISGTDGKFTFTLPTSVKTVIVSFLGYETLKLDLTQSADYTIRLAPSTMLMDEVVVTGYQKIEKRKLTSSIATVDMDAIARTAVASVDQMLEGQLAGVFSAPTSGAPGSSAKVRIRTAVTLSGTDDPLWVLDGMPLEGNDIPRDWNDKSNIDNLRSMSIAGINPDDIEDITVLKDAAATAIYGARAANGVIIITTKKGRLNQDMRVNVSGAVFVTDRPNMSRLNLMNASEKVDWELQLAGSGIDLNYKNMGGVSRILGASGRQTLIDSGFDALPQANKDAINALRTQGADWANLIYRPTVNQQYGVSISGGGNKAAYFFSAGYYKEQGTTRGTGFDRFNITLKTDYDLLKNLRFGVSMFGTAIDSKSNISAVNGFTNAARYTRTVNPYLEAYNEIGEYVYDPDMMLNAGDPDKTDRFNFIEEGANSTYGQKTKSLKSIFDLDYKPINGLKLYTQFGLQVDNVEMERVIEDQTYYMRRMRREKESSVLEIPEGGTIKNGATNDFLYNWKVQAQYNKTFNRLHDIDVMAGLEMRGNTNKNVTTQGFGFDPKTLLTKPIIFDNTAAGKKQAMAEQYRQYAQSFYENRFLSYFATASYTYDNRYTVFGSMRYDGTNLFGVDPEFKFTPLWSISAAWNINREEWLRNVSWLNNLKLRASYGVQGNIDRSTSPYVTGSWGNTNIGGNNESMIDANLPNRYLRWETTNSWNAAVDFAVLENRLMGTFEAYGRVSNNLITPQMLPIENGIQYINSNNGKMSGGGYELSLSSVNISNKSFRWTTMLNIATNWTRIDKINYEANLYAPSRQGHSGSVIFGYKTAGIDEFGAPIMVTKDGKHVSIKDYFGATSQFVQDPNLGDIYKNSYQGNPEKIKELQTVIGNSVPKYTGGFINRFNYKNFDLTVGMNFVIDQTVMANPFYNPTEMNPGYNISREAFNIFSPKFNPNGTYPGIMRYVGSMTTFEPTGIDYASLILNGSPSVLNNLDIWARSMSYLRVNSIRFGYTLPSEISRKMRLNSMRFSFEARNPFVISTNYKGYFDPESYGNIYAQPLAQTFSLGINLSF